MDSIFEKIKALSPEKREFFEKYLLGKGGSSDTNVKAQPYKHGLYVKKELWIKLQKEVNVYLYRAFPVCIILANENLLPWYTHINVQMYARIFSDGYVICDYLEDAFFFREVMNWTTLGYARLELHTDNIVDYIIDRINEGYYINVCVDEYYLMCKSSYLKVHYVHENQIYGYDNTERVFKGIGFDKNEMLNLITFEYEDFLKAFNEGKNHYMTYAPYAADSALTLFSLKDWERERALQLDQFIINFNSFLSSTGDIRKVSYFCQPGKVPVELSEKNIVYGMNATKIMLEAVKKMFDGQFLIDYRAIHLLAEHRKGLFRKLEYIKEKMSLKGEVAELIKSYKQIPDMLENVRVKVLNGLNPSEHNSEGFKQTLCEIVQIMESIIEREPEALRPIYRHLSGGEEPG